MYMHMHTCMHAYIHIYIPIDILLNPTKYPYIVRYTATIFRTDHVAILCCWVFPVVYIYVHI